MINIDLNKLSDKARKEVESILKAKKTTRKTLMLSARISPQVMEAVYKFQRKYNLDFRNDAVIKLIEIGCAAADISISQEVSQTPQITVAEKLIAEPEKKKKQVKIVLR